MNRVSRVLLSAALLGAASSAPAARPDQAPPQETPGPAPAAAPAAPATPDPLLEFVPRERLKADSVVALPVDI
jgi:hypothetical protein